MTTIGVHRSASSMLIINLEVVKYNLRLRH